MKESKKFIPKNERFEVQGAGFLVIHGEPGSVHLCGTAKGISLACTWGKYGEAGGVMDKAEVERLIVYLQEWLK